MPIKSPIQTRDVIRPILGSCVTDRTARRRRRIYSDSESESEGQNNNDNMNHAPPEARQSITSEGVGTTCTDARNRDSEATSPVASEASSEERDDLSQEVESSRRLTMQV